MAEERTVSNFTKLNSPDRGRQKASTLVCMTQIKQHERGLQNHGAARRPAPTLRFRDLSDLATPISKTALDPENKEKAALDDKVANQLTEYDDAEDLWEEELELDERIEVPPRGPEDGFPIAEGDGVDLQEPCLLDLLSDDPIPGAIDRNKENQSSNTKAISAASQVNGPLGAESFKF